MFNRKHNPVKHNIWGEKKQWLFQKEYNEIVCHVLTGVKMTKMYRGWTEWGIYMPAAEFWDLK